MAKKHIGEDNMGTDIFVGNELFNEKTCQCMTVVEQDGCCFLDIGGTLVDPKEYLSLHKKYVMVKTSEEKCINLSCVNCCDVSC